MNEREFIEMLQRFQDARVSFIKDSCHGRDTEASRRQLATAGVDLYATLVGKYAERKEAEEVDVE